MPQTEDFDLEDLIENLVFPDEQLTLLSISPPADGTSAYLLRYRFSTLDGETGGGEVEEIVVGVWWMHTLDTLYVWSDLHMPLVDMSDIDDVDVFREYAEEQNATVTCVGKFVLFRVSDDEAPLPRLVFNPRLRPDALKTVEGRAHYHSYLGDSIRALVESAVDAVHSISEAVSEVPNDEPDDAPEQEIPAQRYQH
jgi:hypothetical protein